MDISTKYSDIDLESVINNGDDAMQEEHAKNEVKKQGILRGGNTGCIVKGEVYGCHRQSIARALGYNIPADRNSLKFFTAGYGIEDQIAHKLTAGWDDTVKQEEEVPVAWKLPSGRDVTGRPDFMLQRAGQNVLGVELKTVVSTNTAKQVWLYQRPQTKHLCQAAHYSWQHKTPWVLTYVSPARYNLTRNRKEQHEFPDLDYFYKIDPFHEHFYLRFEDGFLVYKHPVTKKDIKTVISIKGIHDYYRLVDECLETKSLYYTPINRYADGTIMPYGHVKYCDYCTAAEKANGNWEHWLDELSISIEQRSK